jgi:hypothetical protein
MASTNCTKEIAEFYLLTQSKLARIWERDDKKCRWCGVATVLTKHTIPNQATIDHVIPSSKGGSSEDHNLVLACLKCNAKRGDSGKHPNKSPLPWRANFAKPTPKELEQEPLEIELNLARTAYASMKEKVAYLESLTPVQVMRLWLLKWLIKKVRQ